LFEEGSHQGHAQGGADGVASPCSIDLENLGEASPWVLDRIIFFCKKMGLAIEGREMELLSFLASLETNRMRYDHLVEESVGDDVAGDRLFPNGANH